MPLTLAQIEKEVFSLPGSQRLVLAQDILSASSQTETALGKAWYDEAASRLAAYRAGKLAAVPGEEAFAQASRRLHAQ